MARKLSRLYSGKGLLIGQYLNHGNCVSFSSWDQGQQTEDKACCILKVWKFYIEKGNLC